MKKYSNGQYIEMTEEEISELRNVEPPFEENEVTIDDLVELVSVLTDIVLGSEEE